MAMWCCAVCLSYDCARGNVVLCRCSQWGLFPPRGPEENAVGLEEQVDGGRSARRVSAIKARSGLWRMCAWVQEGKIQCLQLLLHAGSRVGYQMEDEEGEIFGGRRLPVRGPRSPPAR
ncbi:hypothetical protein B0J14DRAFT_49564 [Halenospora varia]|nr:hypothetical protein B0J14DRAFT_49564 [Halenospora varia]